MNKESKVFTESFLYNLFYRNNSFAYRYPDDLNRKMGELNERFEDVTLWNKRRDDILIGRYYVVASLTRNGIFTDAFHVKGFGDNVDEYVGDEISINNGALCMYTDTDFIIERYVTICEITPEFFNDLKNDVIFFRDIVGVLDQNNVPINIDSNVYKQYVVYRIDNGILPYHKEISDMTVSDFVKVVEKYNYGVLQHMDYLKKYCNDKLRGRYIIYFGDRGKITVMKVADFKVKETGNDDGIMMFNLAFDNEKMMIYGNIGCMMFKFDNSLVKFFDNGSIYYMLSEDKGNALLDCYRRIRTKIESFLNKEIK